MRACTALRNGPCAGNASAQEQGAGASQPVLEEVVVTAEKRSERLQDVPLSIVALTSADLQNSGAVTLQDIGREVPGLSDRNFSPRSEYAHHSRHLIDRGHRPDRGVLYRRHADLRGEPPARRDGPGTL